MAWDPCVPAPTARVFKWHQHLFGKELTDDVNACGYYRLPADSYAAIDMGELEVTPAMHAVISGLTSARTGGEIRFSKFNENMTTPSMQLRMDLEATESELIPVQFPESTQTSDDGALLHLGKQTPTLIAQAMLSASRFLQQSPTTEYATTSV